MYDYNLIKNFDIIIHILNRLKLIDIYNLIQTNVNSHIAIIMYHHIGNKKDSYLLNRINTTVFERQMKYIQNTYNIISFKELINAFVEKISLPRNAAIITFDDGYKNNYSEAFPILKKYNIPATIFLTIQDS